MSRNVKLILLIFGAIALLFFMFKDIIMGGSVVNNSRAESFVVPDKKEEQKSREELYRERRLAQGRDISKSQSIEDLFETQSNIKENPINEEQSLQQQSVIRTAPTTSSSQNTSRTTQVVAVAQEPIRTTEQPLEQTVENNHSVTTQNSNNNRGQNIPFGSATQVVTNDKLSFSATVFNDQTITRQGTVRIRNMEAFTIDGVQVPRNTIIPAIASVGNNVVNLSIRNFVYNGKSLNINAVAYTAEGEGVLFESSEARKNVKSGTGSLVGVVVGEATNNSAVGNVVGSTINNTTRSAINEQPVLLPDGFKITFIQR